MSFLSVYKKLKKYGAQSRFLISRDYLRYKPILDSIFATGESLFPSLSAVTDTNNNIYLQSQGSNATGGDFIISGTKYLFLDSVSHRLIPYAISPAYNVSNSGTYEGAFYTQTVTTAPVGVAFKPDGSKWYILTVTVIYQMSMSTPGNVTTASSDGISKDISAQFGANAATWMRFAPDGATLFVGNAGVGGTVYQYTLSSPWDVSTASYASKSFTYGGIQNTARDLVFSANGKKALLLGTASVWLFTLSTAYDVSTMAYASQTYTISGKGTNGQGISLNATDTAFFYLTAQSDRVYEFTMA